MTRDGTREDGTREDGTREDGTREDGTREDGTREDGTREDGTREDGTRKGRHYISLMYAHRNVVAPLAGAILAAAISCGYYPSRVLLFRVAQFARAMHVP